MLLLFAFIALIHYKENPVVTSIVAIVMIFFSLYTWIEVIDVYPDRFILIYDTLIPYFSKRVTYSFDDIKSISIDGFYTLSFELVEDFLPIRHIYAPWNRLTIEFRNGEIKTIRTRIYKGGLRKAVQHIMVAYHQHLLHNRINHTA